MNERTKDMDAGALSKRVYLPFEALTMLGEEAQDALAEWLRKAEAPPVVLQLTRDLEYLHYLEMCKPDEFPYRGRETWNEELAQTVGALAWGIQLLGGKFGDVVCKKIDSC